ncbi:MAG: hypothetical protein HBSAPP03_04040 [Phycisphaerae bacterium]|nr:MAG: hypothetical protein HBSAPP03_04040 [Phycisphaerae bacterium]
MTRVTSNLRTRRAATLVELVVSITILAIVAGVSMPVIAGATDAYAGAAEARRACERGAYALEKSIRLLRDAPDGDSPGTLGIASASATEIVFTDGRGLRLTGTTLSLLSPGGGSSVLCEDVDSFALTCLASDGRTSTAASLTSTQRFHVSLTVRSFSLHAAAFPRMKAVTP